MAKGWVFVVCTAATVGVNAANDLSDFSNNLATDIGPLLVLFGESMTRQYLSESTSFLDYFIFAMAPIGIITAMVSAIRVCGHPSLRAFVGRSQEGDGVVEAELCTSTSRDVCELFNKGGITRVLGRPDVLELVYIPRCSDPGATKPGSGLDKAGLFLFRHYLEAYREPDASGWKYKDPDASGWGKVGASISGRNTKQKANSTSFAPKPNLSLNVGIKRQPNWVFFAVAAVGFTLQAGVLALAGIGVWILHWNLNISETTASRDYAPVMYITGTVLMCGGMWSCAALIGQTTHEIRYERKREYASESRLFWIQPGPQVVGDQSFDPFAYFDRTDDPLLCWTSSRKEFDERFEIYTFIAVSAGLIGYIMQFIGLRGMKAWVSLAQLGATVVMSILRGLLRMQRLGRDGNKLTNMPDLVVGHELDWLAFEIAREEAQEPPRVQRGFSWQQLPNNKRRKPRKQEKEPTRPLWYVTGQHEKPAETETRDNDGLNMSWSRDSLPLPDEHTHSSCGAPLHLVDDQVDYKNLLPIRERLSCLTGHFPFGIEDSEHQKWRDEQVKVRKSARKLSDAICQASGNLFRKNLRKNNITLRAKAVISLIHGVSGTRDHGQSIEVILKPPPESNHGWIMDSARIEAILGLWMWSLISDERLIDEDDSSNRNSYAEKAQTVRIVSAGPADNSWDRKANRQGEMNLWLGPNAMMLSETTLCFDKQDNNSPIDLWKASPDGCSDWEEETEELQSHQSTLDWSSTGNSRLHWWKLALDDPSTRGSLPDKGQSDHSKTGQWPIRRYCGWNLVHELVGPTDRPSGSPSTPSPQHLDQQVNLRVQFIPTGRSLLDTCTHELFVALIKSLANFLIIERATVVESAGDVRLDNPTVAALATAFVENGLGSHSEALCCIIPALRDQLQPDPAVLLSALIRGAETYWEEAEWKRAEILLRWACAQFYSPQGEEAHSSHFFTRALHASAELYRWSLAEHSDDERRVFGVKGIMWMNEKYRNTGDEEVKEILERYTRIAKKLAQKPTGQDLPQYATSAPNLLVEAIEDRNRTWALYHLCFVTTRDVSSLGPALPLAVRNKWSEVINALLKMKMSPNSRDRRGRNAVWYCAEVGDEPYLRRFIDLGAFLDQRDDSAKSPLYRAAENGHERVVKILLDTGQVDCDTPDRQKKRPLYMAAMNGHDPVVRQLLEKGALVDSRCWAGSTALHWAARNGHETVVRRLLEKGADVNLVDNSGKGAVHKAAENGSEEIVAQLIENSGDVDSDSETALLLAASRGHNTLVQWLLEKGANMEANDCWGNTPLQLAAIRRHDKIVTQLLEKGADTESKDDSGRTALSNVVQAKRWRNNQGAGTKSKDVADWTPQEWAAFRRHNEIVKQLLEKGADIESTDNSGRTPLSYAAKHGYETFVQKLLDRGADIESRDYSGRTPLSWAAKHGHEVFLQQLLEEGVDIESKDNSGRTPLSWAAENGRVVLVQRLLEAGVDIESKDDSGRTPLSWASKNGCVVLMQRLLEAGADIESKDNSGRTPLSWAALNITHSTTVQLLLERGAEIESKDNSGRTPLSWAAANGNKMLVQRLLEGGADIESRDDSGRTPLSWATRNTFKDCLQQLLEEGADVEAKDDSGGTPLSWAARKGQEKFVQQLLEKGADIESKDNSGRTPLSWAAGNEYDSYVLKSLVQKLLEQGADVESKDNSGQTPLSWAVENGHESYVQWLLPKTH